jgi:PAS domain S-box-containing protein
MRVLYVEDNALDADLVRRALARAQPPHDVHVVPTLAQARDVLAAPDGYDLVLIDLNLPDGHGLELVAEVRTRRLPVAVVVLTSQGDEPTVVAALKAGADDYQAKCSVIDHLPSTLELALERFRADSARRAGGLRVLYAEHHAQDVDLTRRHCAEHAPHIAFDVVHAASAVLDRLPSTPEQLMPYDVLLLDYRLPGETALDLLKIIRTHRHLDVPVVVVTGQGDEEVATQTLRLGASDYLVKHPHYLVQLPSVLESAHYRAQLARQSRRLTATLESITDAFVMLAHDWRFVYVNHEAERLTRRSRGELLGRTVWDAFPELVGSRFEREYRRAADDRQAVVFEEEFAPLGGRFEVHVYPSDEGLAVYFHDVSARRDAERQLREQASLLDKARDAILVRDLEHTILYWNESAERLYGWSAGDVLGRSVVDILYPDAGPFLEAMALLQQAGEWQGELHHVTRSGEHLVVEARWTLVRDADDAPLRVLSIGTDVTERKRIEAQFLRAQRLESLGTLAGGIAHDLNNVLAPIMMSIDLLAADETDPGHLAMLGTIEASARRGADMVRQILSFARGMEGRRIDLQPSYLLRDIEKIANEAFPKNITARCEVAPEVWNVAGDPTQLHQVLLNLSVNARDAMATGGRLYLRAANVTLDDQFAASQLDGQAGPYVVLEVEDTGCGMPPGVVDRIFEPFYTTKDLDKGTGLGLSTTLAIVKSHGGFIRVYSEPGHGSTFRVFLPALTDRITEQAPPVVGADLPRGRGEAVLVVDDEDAIRDVTRQTLEAHGYVVRLAADGAEAVVHHVSRAGEIDIILADMMMPVMDGRSTVHALRSLNPNVRIIATSGLSGNAQRAAQADMGSVPFLTKPFTADTLLRAIREALDAPPKG